MGLGRRGTDFEKFCYDNNIHVDGVCDITNDHIDETTKYGNRIIHTNDALVKADYILATNSFVLEDLKERRYKGKVINLQEYMPLG